MRPLQRDRHILCLSSGMNKKLDYSLVELTDGLICTTRGLENRFHIVLEDGRRFTLQ
jgi:hypothetical protein